MRYYTWNNDKNNILKHDRSISFEQVVMHIKKGDILDIIDHPNKNKYPEQRVIIININDYAYAVPFVQHGKDYFLKTIIPSRKLTQQYLR